MEQHEPEEMSSLRRVQNYISNVQPPKYPFAIDRQLAAAGAAVLQQRLRAPAMRSAAAARQRDPGRGGRHR